MVLHTTKLLIKNCGVQNLKLTVIERVRKQDQDIRKAREKYWILRLKPNINNLGHIVYIYILI